MESTAHIGHYSWDGIDYQLFFPDKKTNLEFYEPVDYEYVHRELLWKATIKSMFSSRVVKVVNLLLFQ